jgi:hypothetical protein
MTRNAGFLVPTASALRASWLATILVMSLICACGGSETTLASACAPGQSISCTGVGPCAGSQTCKEDGSGYDPCVCSANGGGGSPNNGADASALDSASGARDGAASGHDSATDSRLDARGSDGSESSKGTDASHPNADSGPTNLITAGNFPDGTTLWAITLGMGTLVVDGGKGCVTLSATPVESSTLGWPAPPGTAGLTLSPSTSYTFSYSATAAVAITIPSKVGGTSAPYTALVEISPGDLIQTSLTTFTHSFSTPSSSATDMSIGIAFVFPAVTNTICFQDVSLVAN